MLHFLGLNPCFNGRYSQSANGGKQQDAFSSVLILVLMEDTLRDSTSVEYIYPKEVLILVLMEDTLREITAKTAEDIKGLNPCFNGRYSQR